MVVKSVVGEESQLKQAEESLFQAMSSISAQVGLIVGKLQPFPHERGFVYGLLPTPPPADSAGSSACTLIRADDGTSSSRKKKRGGGSDRNASTPSLVVDADWVAEHARQVSRMLVGGMDVIGVYLWAPEGILKTSMPVLYEVVKEVAEAARLQDPDLDERLLIHISYSPRRWTCRSCMLTSMSSNFHPCDFKMGKLLSFLQYFRCTYNFEIRLPICHEDMNSTVLRDVLQVGIGYLVKELKSAKALVDGNLVDEDQRCTSEGPHEVELLLPFMSNAAMEGLRNIFQASNGNFLLPIIQDTILCLKACRSYEIAGIVLFGGTLCASAYLEPKLSMSQAISDIKSDIITSLKSRLDIISEESEGFDNISGESEGFDIPSLDAKEDNGDRSRRKCESELMLRELSENPRILQFPKRVLVAWFPGIFVCDYLKHSDTFENVKDHCKEMLSMEVGIGTDTIVKQEEEASVSALSFWSVAAAADKSERSCSGNSKKGRDAEEKGRRNNKKDYYLFALATALLSLLVAWCMINFGDS